MVGAGAVEGDEVVATEKGLEAVKGTEVV